MYDLEFYRGRVNSGRGNFEQRLERVLKSWSKIHSDSQKEIEEGRDSSQWRIDYSGTYRFLNEMLESCDGSRWKVNDFLEELTSEFSEDEHNSRLPEALYLEQPGVRDAVGLAIADLEVILEVE